MGIHEINRSYLGDIQRDLIWCNRLGKVKGFFDGVMWGGLAVTGSSIVEVPRTEVLRKVTLPTGGGVTGVALFGKVITESLLSRCTNRILDRFGARPTTKAEFDVPDNAERFVSNYAVSAEAIARRVTSPKSIAKGVALAAAATAVAAASAALYVFGLRGNVSMESVTPGFGAMLDGESNCFGSRNTIL